MTVRVRYVVARVPASARRVNEREQMRATLAPLIVRKPYLKVSAKVAVDYGSILRKDLRADAVCETAAAHDLEVC